MNQQQPQQTLFFYPSKIVPLAHLISIYKDEGKFLSSEGAIDNFLLGVFENYLAKRLRFGETIKDLNCFPCHKVAFITEVESQWKKDFFLFSSLDLSLENMRDTWNSLFKDAKIIILE